MKRIAIFKSIVILCALILSSASAWGQSWTKVTSAPSDWSGEYLIVYENSSTEGYCWTGVDAASCYASATISSGSISSKPSGAVSVTIASMTGGYSIKVNGGANNGKYIQNNGNSNGIKFVDSGVATTFTYENNSVTITCGGKNFRYNSNNSDKRFRYYGSAQQVVQLYKKVYTLTYSATNGSISGVVYNTTTAVSSGSSFAEGGKVTLTAQPADGYQFSSWEVSGTGASLSSTTTNPTNFTMGTANATVTASFVASGAPITYAVTYNANGATSGDVPTDNNSYEANTSVTVLGNTGNLAKTGNAFSGWCMNAEGTGTVYGPNNTATFNITANTTLYAKWTPYTITAASNNTNYGSVVLNGSVITATPAEGYTYADPAYTVTSGTATVEQEGNEFTVTPTSNCTVTINFAAIPTHTATFSVNGVTSSQVYAEGSAITFPSKPADISGKKFVGWTTATITGTTNTAPTPLVTSANMGTSDVTFYAVFATVSGSAKTDELTTSTFGSPSNYEDWSNKQASNGSDAKYAGNSTTYDNSAIQIRSNNNNSGIVSTTSGGKVTKVTVSWNTNTSSDRTLDIYGKTSAYSAASDLYDSDKQGTKLGSLYYRVTIDNKETTTTELTIDGNYTYIGLRSKSGAMYLDEIGIQWSDATYSNYCTTVGDETYSVTYDANGATSGEVPTDGTPYSYNASVTVAGNTGSLAKTGYNFNGWNTAADGTGTDRAVGSTFNITENTTLFAKWAALPSITLESYSVEATAAEKVGTINVTYTNIETTAGVEIHWFADNTGTGEYTETAPDWIEAELTDTDFNFSYLIAANTGEARNAYFKIYGVDGEANDVYSNLVTITQAAYVAPAACTWLLTNLEDLTSNDVFVIVSNKTTNNVVSSYAMSNDNGTTNAPSAVEVTVAGNTITGTIASNIQWNISGNSTDGYTFHPNGNTDSWLYVTSSNAKCSVGTNKDKTFKLASNGYLQHQGTNKFIGVYNASDWRGYSPLHNNIADQTFAFYKKVDANTSTLVVNARLSEGRYWATFYNGYARYTLPQGAKAFIMNNDHQLYLLGDGTEIPAGVAAIIISDSDKVVLNKSNKTDEIVAEGPLTGSNSANTKEGTIYMMGIVGNALGFYQLGEQVTTVPAMKAYYEE